ncbi:MAG: hypothetical protein DRO40_11775 [Thermoprotei archaeon]|nr:MAG: hypothetical protein DRO40_11775 [Thermoprotei archaeon]
MSFRSLAKVVATLVIGIVRGRAIAPLLIAIVIPSAIATVFLLAVNILSSQSNIVTASYFGKPSLVYSEAPIDNATCARVFIVNTVVETINGTFEAQIHVADDFEEYIGLNGLRLTSSSEKDSKTIVSIGSSLANRYGLGPGSKISVCIDGECLSGNITHIHRGNRYLEHVIIVSGFEYVSGKPRYLCRVGSNWVLTSIMRDLESSTMHTMWFLSLFTLFAYLPILYLALNKILTILGGDMNVLRSIGVSRAFIRYGFVIACSFLCLLLVLYGVSIGTLLVHLSTWVLRFFGIVIMERPVLPLDVLSLLIMVFLAVTVVEAFIVSRRIGEPLWSGL